MAKLLSKLAGEANIRLHEGDARDIIEALPDASLGRVFILFPDPWPKTRHHKRRFVQTEMLDALARVMKPGAELRFASDDAGYVEWTLERLMAHPAFAWTARTRRGLENPPARLAANPLRGQGPAWPPGLSFIPQSLRPSSAPAALARVLRWRVSQPGASMKMHSISRLIRAAICLAVLAAIGVPGLAAGEGRPAEKTPFPAIADWGSLKISLERTACYGTCPYYNVEIRGDGTVTYMGVNFVAAKGVRTGHISEQALRRLYDAFAKADFFWTFDDYTAPITDLPTYTITLSYDGRSKTVEDYAGRHVGMPKEITDLEDAIDAAASTGKWIKGQESN